MQCPRCSADARVLESRKVERGAALRRRRECERCGHRFTTFERIQRGPLYVRKRSGRRQRFDRTKLRAALLNAAHKRPVDPRDVEALVDRVEVAAEAAGGEIPAARVAELCLAGLRELDGGAYLQFAGTLPEGGELLAAGGPGSARLAADDPAHVTDNAQVAASAGRDSVRRGSQHGWFPGKSE